MADLAGNAREFANGLQLALDTTPEHAPWAWVNRDGLREVIAFLRCIPEGNHRSTDPDAGQNRQMFPGVVS